MSLSCSCDVGDDDFDTYWWPPKEYSTFKKWSAKHCACIGCNTRISYGDTVGRIDRSRPGTEWEEDHGICLEGDPEGVWLASDYMCEECVDLYFSFEDLGFECVSPYENMRTLAKEYHNVYQTKRTDNEAQAD